MDAKPSNISEVFLAKNVLTMAQLRVAQEMQRKAGGELGDLVVQLGYTSEEQVARCRAALLDLPFIDLNHVVMDTHLMHAVGKIHLFKYTALPIELRGDGKLLLVVSNPHTALPVLRIFEDALHVPIALGIATKSSIVDRLTRLFGPEFSKGL